MQAVPLSLALGHPTLDTRDDRKPGITTLWETEESPL